MDSVSRLTRLCIGFVLYAAALAAFACPDTVTQYRAQVEDHTGATVYGSWQSSVSAACSEGGGLYASGLTFDMGATHYSTTGSAAMVSSTCTFTGTSVVNYDGYPPGEPGPVTHTISVSSQTITLECTVCGGSVGKPAGAAGTVQLYAAGSASSPVFKSNLCGADNCLYKVASGAIQGADRSEPGPWMAKVSSEDTSATGGTCGDEATNPMMAPPTCAKGTCPGSVTVGGVTSNVCMACSSSTEQPKTEVKSTDPAASAPGPTVTKITDTKCTDGICTTTTTTTTVGGTAPGTTTEVTTSTKSDFCAKSPTSKVCSTAGSGGGGPGGGGEGDGSSFGGTCASTTCTGDAIQCQIAQEQAKRDCEMKEVLGDGTRTHALAVAGDAAVTAGDTPSAHPRNAANVETHDLSGGFDQTRLIGGGCPADHSFSAMGGTFVMPLSELCTPAGWIGNLLVSICGIACLGILFKGM